MKKINQIFIITIALFMITGCDKNPKINNDDKKIPELINARQSMTYSDRLVAFAWDFIDTPYQLDPLGEGTGFDPDPLYRFDKFDCVTYIEIVIALAGADNFADFITQKKEVSYLNNQIDYIHRRHFFELDHTDALNDITNNMGIRTKNITGIIDKQKWLLTKATSIHSDFIPHKLTLEYIDKHDVLKMNLLYLPQISVVGIVMDNPKLRETSGSDVMISHVGFLVKIDDNVDIIHASSGAGHIIRQDFFEYINDTVKPSKTRVGIKIWDIKTPKDKQ